MTPDFWGTSQGCLKVLGSGLILWVSLSPLNHTTFGPIPPCIPPAPLSPSSVRVRMTLTWAPFHCPRPPCLFPAPPCELPENSPCPGLGPWDPYPPAQLGTSGQSFTGLLPLLTSLCAESPAA